MIIDGTNNRFLQVVLERTHPDIGEAVRMVNLKEHAGAEDEWPNKLGEVAR